MDLKTVFCKYLLTSQSITGSLTIQGRYRIGQEVIIMKEHKLTESEEKFAGLVLQN